MISEGRKAEQSLDRIGRESVQTERQLRALDSRFKASGGGLRTLQQGYANLALRIAGVTAAFLAVRRAATGYFSAVIENQDATFRFQETMRIFGDRIAEAGFRYEDFVRTIEVGARRTRFAAGDVETLLSRIGVLLQSPNFRALVEGAGGLQDFTVGLLGQAVSTGRDPLRLLRTIAPLAESPLGALTTGANINLAFDAETSRQIREFNSAKNFGAAARQIGQAVGEFRDTAQNDLNRNFSGALANVTNAWNTLFAGDTTPLNRALNNLADTLREPQVVQMFQDLTAGLAEFARRFVERATRGEIGAANAGNIAIGGALAAGAAGGAATAAGDALRDSAIRSLGRPLAAGEALPFLARAGSLITTYAPGALKLLGFVLVGTELFSIFGPEDESDEARRARIRDYHRSLRETGLTTEPDGEPRGPSADLSRQAAIARANATLGVPRPSRFQSPFTFGADPFGVQALQNQRTADRLTTALNNLARTIGTRTPAATADIPALTTPESVGGFTVEDVVRDTGTTDVIGTSSGRSTLQRVERQARRYLNVLRETGNISAELARTLEVVNRARQDERTTLLEYLEISASVIASIGSLIESIGNIIQLFGGQRQAGGYVAAGRQYIVGERGPELFQPFTSGNIVPNHQLAGAAAGGGTTVVQNINIDATGADPATVSRLDATVASLEHNFARNAVQAVQGGIRTRQLR